MLCRLLQVQAGGEIIERPRGLEFIFRQEMYVNFTPVVIGIDR